MGAINSRQDFSWVGSDEPHATRRKLILASHPEIKQLMGPDPRFKWIVSGMVVTQFISFYFLRSLDSFWQFFIVAYLFGGVINHSLMLAIHEISHNQAFGHSRPLANKIFGMFANLPIGIPIAISFKKYHLEHHRYQGDDILDTDIPSKFEAKVFTTTLRKILWVILQPLFYSIRPLFVHPKQPSTLEFVNLVIQMTFDLFIVATCGWHVLAYMVFGSLVAMGLHPVAGHFISEHYIMFKNAKSKQQQQQQQQRQQDEKGEEDCPGGVDVNGKLMIPETCSYYGPLNWITFNVGYHVEHHDFPGIPGTRLPLVRKIAPEFYNNLHSHSSWSWVIYKYIIDPDLGPYARVKRPHRPLNDRGTFIESSSSTVTGGDIGNFRISNNGVGDNKSLSSGIRSNKEASKEL